jgi:methyl-accepting chemotaxis protein
VEAARAGEQGRGFAVVASEVRALAMRSASAARDIRQLIRESSERVSNGLTLVVSSNDALQQIHHGMREIVHTMNALALAGNEQVRGIDQVNMAVSQLDLMTQQNAAMVEEMAAASQNLHGLAGELMEHVGFFQVPQREMVAM